MIDLVLGQGEDAVLVSWWKALLILIPFVPWAWLISSRIDKDARYFHLPVHVWNGVNLASGVAALAAMLLIPIFFVGWPVGLILLVGPILAYWKIRNSQVPEDQQFHLSSQSVSERMEQRRLAKAQRGAALEFQCPSGKTHQAPVKDDPLFNVHMITEDLIGPAMDARASRLDIAVTGKGATISQLVDGIRYKRDPLTAEQGKAVLDYIKTIAELDVADHRRRQSARVKVQPSGGAESELQITTMGSSTGVQLRIDVNRRQNIRKPFDGIGLLASQMEALRTVEEAHERHGIVLLGASRGQGLTTTGYAMLGRHDAFTTNVKTLELEVEAPIDGVDQVTWDASNPDVDYATNLQSILRRDPDIVLTMLKDAETAKVLATPGLQGPLLYVMYASNSIPELIRDWVKAVGNVEDAAASLRAVTNQRLLRKLCPNCRQGYTPSADQLKKLNLPAERASQLFRASGKIQVKNKIEQCPVCNGTGYLGQTAAFEVLLVDNGARKLLASGDLKAVMAHARRNKMMYLQEAALSKVLSGETTLDEVARVTAPAGKGSSGQASGASAPVSSAS